mgnify:FL=1
MKSWKSKIKAIIFDCDGVLLDTIPMYAKANSIIIGRPYPDEFQTKVNGLSESVFAQRVIEHFGLKMTPREFIDKRNEILRDMFPNTDLVKGVDKIVLRFSEMGLPMAVATSSFRESHDKKTLKNKELFKLFKVQICGDEVVHAKPDPEIFLKAAAKLGYEPENVLVFEDSYNGIVAANAAGMASTFLANEKEPYQEILKQFGASPSYIIKAFDDFDFQAFDWET